jgi:prevent-host-death family protein
MTIMSDEYRISKKKPYRVAEAKAKFSDLVRRTLVGEEVVIAKDNRPLVRLVPYGGHGPRVPGSAKGLVTMAPDFDEPMEDFAEYQ